MATYAIGDIQGCYDELRRLLDALRFDPAHDVLWLAGDLVNRGPKSLEVLRFAKRHDHSLVAVLGNHDLHLLAVWQDRHRHLKAKDTLRPIFQAPDGEELLHWLRHRPLMHYDERLGYALVHAGLAPEWTKETALRCAGEVEAVLRSESFTDFLDHMYGNEPSQWSDALTGWDRLRFSVNCFTRLRYCTPDGRLEFRQKGAPGSQMAPYIPWFRVPGRKNADLRILFGHWSALGLHAENEVWGLDSGCLWGGRLSAMRLDEPGRATVVSVACRGRAQSEALDPGQRIRGAADT